MIILQGHNIAKTYSGEVLFQNIHLTVHDNSRIALVGRNGTGKSTLLKILFENDTASSGQIVKTKQLRIGYLDQHTGINSTLSIWDEMLSVFAETIALHKHVEHLTLQLSSEQVLSDTTRYEQTLQAYASACQQLEENGGYQYEATIRNVLSGFGFSKQMYHQPVSSLSGGQKTRLALAKLLLEKHDLLLLDEPTNHLDIKTLTWLENYLSHYKGALIIVSHDRYFLDKVATEIYEITQQTAFHYAGNYSFYLAEKAKRLESEWKNYTKQQKEIARLEDFVSRNIVRASTTKRAQSRRKQLEKMTRIAKPQQDDKRASFQFSTQKESGQVVLKTEQLAIGYDNTLLSKPINLSINKQHAIALVGENGVGKSTLLKTILDHLPALEGTIHLGANVSIGYYDQEQRHLSLTKDVLHELWDDFSTTNEKDIRTILGSFLFSGDDVLKPVSSLSGGERARLLLCKLAMKHDNFLILDEPTNHLDLESKEVLEQALIDFDGTILFISHDRYFINRIATTVVELTPNGSTIYLGDYDYYCEKKTAEQTPHSPQKEQHEKHEQYLFNKDIQKQKRTLERTLETLERQMQALEHTNTTLEESILSPEIASDYTKLTQLSQQIEENKHIYQQLMDEWEIILTKLEKL